MLAYYFYLYFFKFNLMDNPHLDSQIEKIMAFITLPPGKFGGVFLSSTSQFDFNCSNISDETENCMNIELTEIKELENILDKLLIDTATESKLDLIKRFRKDASFDRDKTFYLHIYRRF